MKLFDIKNNYQDSFDYLDRKSIYLDSACQTLRPKSVIESINEYFKEYNACGGRVKYEWGKKVDEKTTQCRKRILSILNKKSSEYVVAFTLNTSYGLNLVLQQLPAGKFERIITSEVEHNSVFLSTIEAAKSLGIDRLVLSRKSTGALNVDDKDLSRAVIVLNNTNNFTGEKLTNLSDIIKYSHKKNGIVLIDAAQGMSQDIESLRHLEWDGLFFSGHKFYGPSIGVVVIKKELLKELNIKFVAGGMVESVENHKYKLISNEEELHSRLEIGLQDFSGIIGLNEAIKWYEKYKPENIDKETHKKLLGDLLFDGLSGIAEIKLINSEPSTIITFYSEKIDSHRLAIFLSQQNISVRSGYFCCHNYLLNLKKYPPLLRISLGMQNTRDEVEKFLSVLKAIMANT